MDKTNSSKVAVVQMNSGRDAAGNLSRASALVERAAGAGAGFAVLPEVFAFIGRNLGEQIDVSEDDGDGPIQDFLATEALTHGVWLVGGTFPLRSPRPDRVYAACALYNPQGDRVALYRKMHLFDVHVRDSGENYSESSTFMPGDEVVVADTPLGRCGLAVCYDLRFPELFRAMLDRGVDFIVLPSAFTEATGQAHWETLLRARAVENLVYVAAANQTGSHPNGRTTWGHSMVVDPWGRVLDQLGRDEGIAVAKFDRASHAGIREEFPCADHRRIACGRTEMNGRDTLARVEKPLRGMYADRGRK